MRCKARIFTAVLFSLPLLAQAQSAASENQGTSKAPAAQAAFMQSAASNKNKQQAVSNQQVSREKVERSNKTGRAVQEHRLQSYEQNAQITSVSDTCVLSRASYTYTCN